MDLLLGPSNSQNRHTGWNSQSSPRSRPRNASLDSDWPPSTSFYRLQDRLIQEQWQSDREKQWRSKHALPGFGSFALLPQEIRCQIYEACFPAESVEVDLVEASGKRRPRNGLVSLMRSSRCIRDEIKPLLEKHMQSRLFNLVLSRKGARFERRQYATEFVTFESLQSMKSDTIPPLGLFARTRKCIRNLRLAIQIAPVATHSPDLVPILEPIAMWIVGLLSTAKSLQFLHLDFHLSHEMQIAGLVDDDGSKTSIWKLIEVLLGARAAAHCQSVMDEGLSLELQVVRVVILQKDRDERQSAKKISSFRWERSEQEQHHAHQLEGQPAGQPLSSSMLESLAQSVHRRVPQQSILQEPAPEQLLPRQPVPKPSVYQQAIPEEPVHEKPEPKQSAKHVPQPVPQLTTQHVSTVVQQPPAKGIERPLDLSPTQGNLSSSTAQVEGRGNSLEYSPPSPEVNKDASDHQQPIPEQPTRQPITQPIPALTHQHIAKRPEIPSDLFPAKRSPVSSTARVEEQSNSPEYSPPPPQVSEDLLDHPTKPVETLDTSSPDKPTDLPKIDTVPPEVLSSQAVQKRNHEQQTSTHSHKRRKLDLGDRSSTSESQAASGKLTPKPAASDSKPALPVLEAAAEEEAYVVESLLEARTKNGVSQIMVKWKGYEQTTWEPRTMLMEDVPKMVKKFNKRQRKFEKRQRESSKSGPKTSSEQRSSQVSQREKAVKDSVEAPQEMTETPRTATARMNQWASQQSQAVPAASLAQKPKFASEAPKRPLTAFFLYMQANRPRIWEDLCKQLGNPEYVTQARISAEGTRRWLHLDEAERGAWERIHTKRVAIYHIQMEAFKAGKPIPSQDEARSLVESSTKQTAVVDLT